MNDYSGYQVSGTGAEMYERFATHYMGQWAPDLVEVAALRPAERVLDLACGTGLVARLAADRIGSAGRVTGLDINAGMLAVARAMPPVPGARIDWVEGSATAMDLLDASFDVIVCQQGLQFFPERDAALREMRRVLVPGGRVALSVWKGPNPYTLAVGDALERLAGMESAAKYRDGRLRLVPDAGALREMTSGAGFRAVEVRPRTRTIHLPAIETFVLGHLAGHPVAGAIAALGGEGQAAFARLVKTALQPYADGDGVAYPDVVNVVTARK